MNTLFLGIVIFLIVLAVSDLVVGVSNDAVNFLNSAIGARVARYRTIVTIAAVGVFAGATLSNGMMDVARTLVRTSRSMANGMATVVPRGVERWINSRFNADAAVLKRGAAFDEIRAAVNLVLAGALVALGTSLKLPLSTTYAPFLKSIE